MAEEQNFRNEAKMDQHNEVSNTVAGINTPADHAGQAASDPLIDFVEGTMENIEEAFFGDSDNKSKNNQNKQ